MKKKFNSKSITITTDSERLFDWVNGKDVFSIMRTIYKHDALDILLNSPNPYRKEYSDMDFEAIKILQEKQKDLIQEMVSLLKNSKYSLS
jgi:hypothetical protein